MFGSIQGNIFGILYFMVFQLIGIYFGMQFFKKESIPVRVLFGSVTGSFALQWCPILMAFLFDFTIQAHILGLMLFTLIVLLLDVFYLKKRNETLVIDSELTKFNWREHKIIWVVLAAFLYYVYLLLSHSIPYIDGAMKTGQSTYGDMSMHLGFISSIAKQKTFPPNYSIQPGVKLAYPFLCDSISSSLYLFGSSLRVAYITPMIVAILQVFLGFYCFAFRWLKSAGKALLAWLLFFLDGGLGFCYFFDQFFLDTSRLSKLFTDFYYTPTSLGDQNLRWAQVIVNMLVPQRATLFGWAMLFPLMAVLYRAIKGKNKSYFIFGGIIAGGLPLIHTHSFMALGLICVAWCGCYIYRMKKDTLDMEKQNTIGKYLIVGWIIMFSVLQLLDFYKKPIDESCMKLCLIVCGFVVGVILYQLIGAIKKNGWKELASTWGVLLLIVGVLAIPQLFGFTFKQASNGSFVKGIFNWQNSNDQYIWFYVKNIGIPIIFAIPALVFAKRKDFMTATPMFLIWFVAELMVFQPNIYDNNKLLFVAAVFMCCIAADYMMTLYHKIRAKKTAAVIVMVLATVSALLTMGREFVSGASYEIYGKPQIAVSQYIEKNTDPSVVVLTDARHNNAIAALSGRNIVSGSGSFLFYHGIDISTRSEDVKKIYEAPKKNQDLIKKYNISYILIGPEERGSYPKLDEKTIASLYEQVFREEGVNLYKVK